MEAVAYLIGAGSFTLGVEAAGFRIREVWETSGYGKNAKTWNLNRPEMPVNILELDHTNTSHFIQRGQTHLIFGNPPCGGLSAMTGSHLSSETNTCMRQWMRMVAPAQPAMILMENGYQLAMPRCQVLLDDLTNVLDEHHYNWGTWEFYSYQVGCPQIRRRMFLWAIHEQVPIVQPQLVSLYDLPQCSKKGVPQNAQIWTYLWDLADTPPAEGWVQASTGQWMQQHWYGGNTAKVLDANRELEKHSARVRGKYFSPADYMRQYRKAVAGDEAARKWCEKNFSKTWAECPSHFGSTFASHRPHAPTWDAPCGAIIGAYRYVHPTCDRLLTQREMARIMGYPDSWNFHELSPYLIAQGIPAMNAYWAADRMVRMVGWK